MGEPEQTRERALVVDDTPRNVKLLEQVLTASGYEVSTAASGPEALRLLEEATPDLVLLDIVMPGMNGYEVCEKIRENPETSLLPVVLVTALDPKEERIKGIEAGADDFLTKPINVQELLARVRSLLRIGALHRTVSDQATQLAEWNETLEERVAAAQERLRLLYDLSCAFASRTDLAELIPFVVDRCRDVLSCHGASILVLDAERQELYFPHLTDSADQPVPRFPADRGVGGRALREDQPINLTDASEDAGVFAAADAKKGTISGPLIAAPFTCKGGVSGVIQAIRSSGDATFTDGDLEFLASLAHGVAVAIENAQLYGRLRASEESLRAEVDVLRRDAARRDGFPDIIGSSPAMDEVFGLMESAAASPIAVLVQGETGTGKELVARGIHQASSRASNSFVAVNCGALPESLLESELFGHRKGSFSGATSDQPGLFETASGGTIFLDEIGEMPLQMQVKLLRVLQEGEIVRIGERSPRKVDVRVVSATNRDLEAEVEAGTMRQDLYYRLSAFPIHLPPLRDRRDDVPLFVSHFVAAAARRHEKEVGGIDPAAVKMLVEAEWPGNVRQLQNDIERAVALCRSGETIQLSHLQTQSRSRQSAAPAKAAQPVPAPSSSAPLDPDAVPDLREARAAFETWHIRHVLDAHQGNVSRAARALGLSRGMLQKKMKDYGLRDDG